MHLSVRLSIDNDEIENFCIRECSRYPSIVSAGNEILIGWKI